MGNKNIEDYTRYWRVAQLNVLEMLAGRFVKHRYVPHFHTGYAIGVIEEGAISFKRSRRDYVACGGHIIIINPCEVHEGQAADDRVAT